MPQGPEKLSSNRPRLSEFLQVNEIVKQHRVRKARSIANWKRYDGIASKYDEEFARRFAEPAKDLATLASNRRKRVRLLDFGTGTGIAAAAAHDILPEGSSVVGVDLSLPMLRIAQGRGLSLLVVGNGAHLPFSDQMFDVVIANFVLTHFHDYRIPLAEIIRVLATRGCFAASAWANVGSSLRGDWRRVAESFIPSGRLDAAQRETVPAEPFLSEPENLNRALSEAGLVRISVAVRNYKTQVSLAEFVAERALGGVGRFMRHELDSHAWERFQSEVTGALRAGHPDPVIIQDTVLLATGYKP